MYPVIVNIKIAPLGIPDINAFNLTWEIFNTQSSAAISRRSLQEFVDQLATLGIEPSVSYKTEQTICFEIDKLPRWAPTIILDDLDDIDLDDL